MPKAENARPGTRAAGRAVHTIKVTLRGSKPPIWRRLQVRSDCTLSQLHGVIQNAFGWEDYHMWAFEAARRAVRHCRPRAGDPQRGRKAAQPGRPVRR